MHVSVTDLMCCSDLGFNCVPLWPSGGELHGVTFVNINRGHFCEHRPRTCLCDFDFDCCGIAMQVSVIDLICCCDLGFSCVPHKCS
jgi:hypothetical protein